MAAPRDQAASKDKASPPAEEEAVVRTVSVVVAQRRSLTVPVVVATRGTGDNKTDVIAHRTMGPGSVVEIAIEEVAYLRMNGFLEPGSYTETAPPAPISVDPQPTINGRDGSSIEVDRA